jgi:hypothetical protein
MSSGPRYVPALKGRPKNYRRRPYGRPAVEAALQGFPKKDRPLLAVYFLIFG